MLAPKNCQRENNSSPLRWCTQLPGHWETSAIGRKIAATSLKTGAECETP